MRSQKSSISVIGRFKCLVKGRSNKESLATNVIFLWSAVSKVGTTAVICHGPKWLIWYCAYVSDLHVYLFQTGTHFCTWRLLQMWHRAIVTYFVGYVTGTGSGIRNLESWPQKYVNYTARSSMAKKYIFELAVRCMEDFHALCLSVYWWWRWWW